MRWPLLALLLAGCPGGTGSAPFQMNSGQAYAASSGMCGMMNPDQQQQCEAKAARSYAINARREDIQRQEQAQGEAYAYERNQQQDALTRENRRRCEPMAVNTVRCGIYQTSAISAVIDACTASLTNGDRVYGMTVCMVSARDCSELRDCMGTPRPPSPPVDDEEPRIPGRVVE